MVRSKIDSLAYKLSMLGYSIKRVGSDKILAIDNNTSKECLFEVTGDKISSSDDYDSIEPIGQSNYSIVKSGTVYSLMRGVDRNKDRTVYRRIKSWVAASDGRYLVVVELGVGYVGVVDIEDNIIIPLSNHDVRVYRLGQKVVYKCTHWSGISIYSDTGHMYDMTVGKNGCDILVCTESLISYTRVGKKSNYIIYNEEGKKLLKVDSGVIKAVGNHYTIYKPDGSIAKDNIVLASEIY